MPAEASILSKYYDSSPAKRVSLILRHYSNFEDVVDGYSRKISHRIAMEKELKRQRSKGDLGVRVQTSGNSDPTGNAATSNVMIYEQVSSCDLQHGLLDDLDNEDVVLFAKELVTLQVMREEYELVESQVRALDVQDKSLLLAVMNRDKSMQMMAEEKGIAYESVKQAVWRAKRRVKDNVVPYLREVI